MRLGSVGRTIMSERISYGKLNEAELQAELYCRVKVAGLDPRLEVKACHPGGALCRFDVVVFWPLNHKPICIIECKKSRSVKNGCGGHRQVERYKAFGLPVLLCCRNDVEATLKRVRACAAKDFSNAPASLKKAQAWQDYLNELDGVK